MNSILNLPGFIVQRVEGYSPIIFEVRYKQKAVCPHCGGKRLRKKDTFIRQVWHELIGVRRSQLRIKAHKYHCRSCGRYFNLHLAYLLIQLFGQTFALGFFFSPLDKAVLDVLERLLFPPRYLRRMYLVFRRDLIDRQLPFDRLQCYSAFKFRTKCSSLYAHFEPPGFTRTFYLFLCLSHWSEFRGES